MSCLFLGFGGSEVKADRVPIYGFSNPLYNGKKDFLTKVRPLTREARISAPRPYATVSTFKPKQEIPTGLRDSSKYQLEDETFYDACDESSMPLNQQLQNELKLKLDHVQDTNL